MDPLSLAYNIFLLLKTNITSYCSVYSWLYDQLFLQLRYTSCCLPKTRLFLDHHLFHSKYMHFSADSQRTNVPMPGYITGLSKYFDKQTERGFSVLSTCWRNQVAQGMRLHGFCFSRFFTFGRVFLVVNRCLEHRAAWPVTILDKRRTLRTIAYSKHVRGTPQ